MVVGRTLHFIPFDLRVDWIGLFQPATTFSDDYSASLIKTPSFITPFLLDMTS